MSAFRMKRINEQVKRELSDLIRKYLPVEDHGLISVTEVDVSKDLKNANVYISAIHITPDKMKGIISSLEKIRVHLQHELSRKVVMKYTPHLTFKKDLGIERGQYMVDLLDSLETKSKENS